jgi:ribonuclease R
VVTIDPKDAKDFDDAVFLRKLPDGGWKLWVHIADVSYYVRPGTALDKEARKRANSTYLIDRVIPMLPERLSNDLCSLRPNEDRLTKCVEFDIDRHGKVRRFEFYSAVIHSKQRFTYEEVQAVLARPAKGKVEIMLHQAQSLAAKLRSLRMGNGSLDLSMPEYRFELDSHNRLCGVICREPDASHQLIEEFMLLANEAAAKKMADRKGKALYRIHQAPDEERLIQFGKSLKAHDIRVGNLTRPKEVQSLLNQLGKHPIGQVLQIGLLRCLKQARYYPERVMHYGLAKEFYTHFTSPIRRYSDLVVHRILFESDRDSGRDLFALSDHLSTNERSSAEAEQAHKFLILYDYLESQLLLPVNEQKTFEASVTEIRNFGMFIELAEYGVSGLLPVSSLKDDFYVYQADRNLLVGRRRRKVFRLGDSLKVRILKVDRFKKQVDFTLVTSSVKKSGKKKTPSEKREKKAEIGEKSTITAREKPAEKKGKMGVRKFFKKKHVKPV